MARHDVHRPTAATGLQPREPGLARRAPGIAAAGAPSAFALGADL